MKKNIEINPNEALKEAVIDVVQSGWFVNKTMDRFTKYLSGELEVGNRNSKVSKEEQFVLEYVKFATHKDGIWSDLSTAHILELISKRNYPFGKMNKYRLGYALKKHAKKPTSMKRGINFYAIKKIKKYKNK